MEGIPMGEAGTAFLLSQLVFFAPVLVVYLVAIILALVYLGRARGPALLTLAGVGVLVVTLVGAAVAQAWLIESRQTDGLTVADFAGRMRTVGIGGTCFHAAGLGLLVAAIFVGRRAPPSRAEPFAAAEPDRG
jgi:hypothetical protein